MTEPSLLQRGVDLRERRRRATMSDISEAALTLFERNGMAATTVHDIAEAAGISDRTCFRYLPSKEEAVLTLQAEFDEPLAHWLEGVRVDEPALPQLERVYAAVLVDLDGPLAAVAAQQRRVRRLMFDEPALRAAAFSLDATRSWTLAQRMAEAFGDRLSVVEARLVTDYAGLALRQAFDLWAEATGSGEPATLTASYAAERARLAGVAATSGPARATLTD